MMEKAPKEVAPEITPAEEIKVTTEEIVAEAKDEVKEAPSRIRKKVRQLALYGRVPASGRAPPDRMWWAPTLPGCTVRSSKR